MKNLKLIDATTISLNMNDFSWAKFRSTKGGIKINTRFDYDLDCADYLFITNANKHENSTQGQMRLTENDIAVFDRGYFNKRQFLELTESSISFVTRNKSNIEYEVISSDRKEKSDDSFTIRRDEIIRMKIGNSKKNAVKAQIWIALTVHLLFLILKAETRQNNRTFSSFCSEISVVLFKHRNLEKWFARDYEKFPPMLLPDKNSLWLFDDLVG